MKLLIGNKNYSSWSLRPWLLLKQLGIPFEEEALSFNDPQFKARIKRHSPAGMLPVLVDGDLAVWDTLAIVEYVAERFPEHGVWPQAVPARARARSVCAEMHAGFSALRERLPMNCQLTFPSPPPDLAVKRDIARVVQSWTDCREQFGAGGPFLFGAFSAADAYYAPVVLRFLAFNVDLPEVARRYLQTVRGLPPLEAWVAAGQAEDDFFAEDEPFREDPRKSAK
jgi:glutathione S-transferase